MRSRAPDRLETARMIGERYRSEHLSELTSLMLDPQVAATLWPRNGPRTGADVRRILERGIEHWRRQGFGMWLLRDRADDTMVGRGGLRHTLVTGVDEVEVGWAITPERWGNGLATELAEASVRTAFDELQLDSVIAYTLIDNAASRRVMEKAGMRYERGLEHLSLPHVVYRRDRGSVRGPLLGSTRQPL